MANEHPETGLVLQDRLEHILSLEDGACPESMVVKLCQQSAVLWADTNANDKRLFLIKAAQVYSFATTEVKDNGRTVKKWQVTQIPDENGVLPERARSWKQFCLDHLRIHPSVATSLKRTWEVYRVTMGYDFESLLRAGQSKLGTAVGTVASLLPGMHEGLMEALFGNERKCLYCKHQMDQSAPPLSCPKCGAEWTPVPPGTLAQVILIINQIKALQQELSGEDIPSEDKPTTEGGWHYDEASQEAVWVGYFIQGDERIPLPAWRIRVFEDDVVIPGDETGIHFCQIPDLREALSRGLKQ